MKPSRLEIDRSASCGVQQIVDLSPKLCRLFAQVPRLKTRGAALFHSDYAMRPRVSGFL
jgi:hypothetical protein